MATLKLTPNKKRVLYMSLFTAYRKLKFNAFPLIVGLKAMERDAHSTNPKLRSYCQLMPRMADSNSSINLNARQLNTLYGALSEVGHIMGEDQFDVPSPVWDDKLSYCSYIGAEQPTWNQYTKEIHTMLKNVAKHA